MTRATAAIAAAIIGTALAVGMFGAGTATAEDDKHWYFDVVNESNDTAIELRTQEDGEWSENWLSNRLEPGDTIKLDFETDEGKCEVRTQIHLTAAISTRRSTSARPRPSSSSRARWSGSEWVRFTPDGRRLIPAPSLLGVKHARPRSWTS